MFNRVNKLSKQAFVADASQTRGSRCRVIRDVARRRGSDSVRTRQRGWHRTDDGGSNDDHQTRPGYRCLRGGVRPARLLSARRRPRRARIDRGHGAGLERGASERPALHDAGLLDDDGHGQVRPGRHGDGGGRRLPTSPGSARPGQTCSRPWRRPTGRSRASNRPSTPAMTRSARFSRRERVSRTPTTVRLTTTVRRPN